MSEHGLPNPRRHTDSRLGLLSKVFIVYAHNPRLYQWPRPLQDFRLMYPQCSQEELRHMQGEEKKLLEREQEERVGRQNELVHRFAQFLDSHKIAVAYEGLLLDRPVDSYMRWFQEQMKDSDYILLIVTDSLSEFLSKNPPEEKERIFSGNFLHNYVHLSPSSPERRPILPIFIHRKRKLDLLPDALRASSTYEIKYREHPPHFDVQEPELDRLYALLTRQDRIQPPTQVSVVPVVSSLRRRGEGDCMLSGLLFHSLPPSLPPSPIGRDAARIGGANFQQPVFESLPPQPLEEPVPAGLQRPGKNLSRVS